VTIVRGPARWRQSQPRRRRRIGKGRKLGRSVNNIERKRRPARKKPAMMAALAHRRADAGMAFGVGWRLGSGARKLPSLPADANDSGIKRERRGNGRPNRARKEALQQHAVKRQNRDYCRVS